MVIRLLIFISLLILLPEDLFGSLQEPEVDDSIRGGTSSYCSPGFAKLIPEKFLAREGIPISQGPFSEAEFAENNISKLSDSGMSEGEGVFRLIAKSSEESKTAKFYGDEYDLEKDLRAMSEIDQVTVPGGRVRVVGIKKVSPKRTDLQDVKGESLDKVWQNLRLSFEMRKALLDDYKNFLRETVERLKVKYPNQVKVLFANEVSVLVSVKPLDDPNKWTQIYLKPDNFIVDSRTLEMWIVDPY